MKNFTASTVGKSGNQNQGNFFSIKKFLFFGFTLCFLFSIKTYAQPCLGTNTVALPLAIQTVPVSATSQAGKYLFFNVTAGHAYKISSALATQAFNVREGAYNNAVKAYGGSGMIYYA